MSDKSNIEWTDATWNPATGCTKVSPGCANCYIERTPPFRINHRRFDAKGAIPIQLHHDRLTQPLHWKRPRRVFVNSLSDLFHEDIPTEFIDKVFAVMALCPRHQFQILTKRPERMLKYAADPETQRRVNFILCMVVRQYGPQWPLSSVWLGVTVENQHFADERIPLLLETPAAVRFVSAEPLLGPLDISPYLLSSCVEDSSRRTLGGIVWTIAGGESGPGARPMHPKWARSVRDQCQAAGVPFFMKQWGEWAPLEVAGDLDKPEWKPITAKDAVDRIHIFTDQEIVFRIGKKEAGRLLDGREWNEYPNVERSDQLAAAVE